MWQQFEFPTLPFFNGLTKSDELKEKQRNKNNNRELKQRQRRRQRERQKKKSKRLDQENNNFTRASRFFVHFFTVVARLQRESA